MYERENWRHLETDEEVISNTNLKLNTYLNYTYRFNENFTMAFMSYFQSKMDKDILHPRISPTLQMNFKVSSKISFVSSAAYTYDTKPVIPIRKYNYSFVNSFRFSF